MENNEIVQGNELSTAINQISVMQGSVVFGGYEDLREQAIRLAEQIKTVEVSEDNVKISKKLLAEVNKRLKELEDKRISIKKMMLEPYQTFEDQVKDIVGIVKDADVIVRNQVKELESKERLENEQAILEIWVKRVQAYSFPDLVSFHSFLNPKHLTKTMTIQAVEKEMVQFLEKVQNDMNVLETLDDSGQHIDVYLECFDLAQTMTSVKAKKERQAQIEQARNKTKAVSTDEIYLFTVVGKKDARLVEMLLIENDIKFEMEKE